MPYSYRNSILTAGLLVSIFFIICFAFSIIVLWKLTSGDFSLVYSSLEEQPAHSWWLHYRESSANSALFFWHIGGLTGLFLVCILTTIVLKRIFRRTASAEIFFFVFFLYSLSFEAIWTWNAVLTIRGSPVFIGVLLTKITHFGRLFGLMSLVISSLNALEISRQKFSILLAGSFLISLVLIDILPMDSSVLLSNFHYRPGDERGLWIITLALEAVAIVNYLVAAYRRERRELALIALGILLILVGRELLLFWSGPLHISIGLALTSVGIWFFTKQINRIYLWT
jgi:hypothetical protein